MGTVDAVHFSPPAPVALVTLRDPATRAVVTDVPLLLDTGADVTLLPRQAVETLGVTPLSGVRYELVGFDGSRSAASAVELDLALDLAVFRGRYLLIDDERGIIGRDILNHLATVFDGPRQQWSANRQE